MTDPLSTLLATRDWILADGATGTNLFNMGLMAGDAPEMWNEDHPALFARVLAGTTDTEPVAAAPGGTKLSWWKYVMSKPRARGKDSSARM